MIPKYCITFVIFNFDNYNYNNFVGGIPQQHRVKMAKTYPEHLLQSIIDDPLRNAERKVYEQLSKLSDKFVVFYSVAWQSREHGIARDGEADFVVAHPDLGILVMEVKGGGVAFNGTTGEWHTVDRRGVKHVIKDPIEQAKRNHYTLLDKLMDLPGWKHQGYINIGHVVCFPDISISSADLKLDLPREIVLDHDDLAEIHSSIIRIFDYYASKGRRTPLGRECLSSVEALLAHSISIHTPLGVELEKEDEKLVQLTEQQMSILSLLRTRRRAAISGCAGSGKTMLAVEKARRLAKQGFDVLLTCFNIALAQELQMSVENIAVEHFHGLCKAMATESGFSLRKPANEQEYNDVILPDELFNAAINLGPQFDAIVVDEGQDFKDTYWIALDALLRPDGIFYVFFDDNQNLYGGSSVLKEIIEVEPFSLSENCRNTQAIHKLVSGFHSQPDDLICRGPIGHVPELLYYRDAPQLVRLIKAKLHHLIVDEHIAPQDVVILTPRSQDHTQLKVGMQLGNFILVNRQQNLQNGIQVTSIHAFKGLERRVVIIAEIDDSVHHQPEIVMYVGCSRARTYLILYAGENLPTDLKDSLESVCKS